MLQLKNIYSTLFFNLCIEVCVCVFVVCVLISMCKCGCVGGLL